MSKCQHKDGDISRIGLHEVDPCVYKEVQTFRNVTVHVMECTRCGNVEISWERQEDTEELEVE